MPRAAAARGGAADAAGLPSGLRLPPTGPSAQISGERGQCRVRHVVLCPFRVRFGRLGRDADRQQQTDRHAMGDTDRVSQSFPGIGKEPAAPGLGDRQSVALQPAGDQCAIFAAPGWIPAFPPNANKIAMGTFLLVLNHMPIWFDIDPVQY